MGSRAPARAAVWAATVSLALVPAGAVAGSRAVKEAAVRPAPARPLVSRGLERALAYKSSARVMVALRQDMRGRRLASTRAAVAAAQGRVLRRVGRELRAAHRWRAVPALAATVTRAGLARLRSSPDVASVDLVRPIHLDLAESVPLIHADAVHALDVTGEGVTVAVIDTGVDTDNPDLADDIRAQACFITRSDGTGGCAGGARRQIGPGAAEDESVDGHGTRVTSIITGNGSASTPKGVAPGAEIVAAKVFDVNGKGSAENILSALDWIINDHPEVRIVNMSLGGEERSGEACDAQPYAVADASALNALYAGGVISFAASGNAAVSTAIEKPACIANVVSVGAVYDADVGAKTYSKVPCSDATTQANRVACFSNAGPVLDLLAPGAWITTAARGGGTVSGAGTSFATPHAAAVAALLLERRPDLTPGQIASTLKQTGIDVVDPRNGATYKRIDAKAALEALPNMGQGTPPSLLPNTSATFGDGTGDDGGGPDLAQTEIASENGVLRFTVRTPNRNGLGPNESVQIMVDVDRNPATGAPGFGYDVAVAAFTTGVELERWANGAWAVVRELYDASYSGDAFTFRISQEELGVASDFDLRILAVDTGGQVRDRGPDSGAWFFPAYVLNLTTAGSGTGVVTGDGISCSEPCTVLRRRGASVALQAAPAAGSVLAAWEGSCSGLADCELAMDGDKVVTARFELLRRLTVAVSGRGAGSVTSRPAAITCGATCTAEFADKTSVLLTARPETGSRLRGWSGACGGDGPCEVLMNEARSVTATFADVAAPVAEVFAARARHGTRARLRFRLTDNSKKARATITVLRGRKKVATLARALAAADGSLYSVQWKVPKRPAHARLTFCVAGTDASGNRAEPSCARLRVT